MRETTIDKHMNTDQVEVWIAPDFEEISAAMECTAYTGNSTD